VLRIVSTRHPLSVMRFASKADGAAQAQLRRRSPLSGVKLLRLVIGGVLLHLGGQHILDCFVAFRGQHGLQPETRRGGAGVSLITRQGRGFAAEDAVKRKRKKIVMEQLKAHHGDELAGSVAQVLKTGKAGSPEEMMRARYSAVMSRDALFLGRTERDPNLKSVDKRAHLWAVIFGQEEATPMDGDGGDSEKLLKAQGFEVIAAEGLEVEYKIDCGPKGILHERSIFQQNDKYGYIYSADSVFEKWLDPPEVAEKAKAGA